MLGVVTLVALASCPDCCAPGGLCATAYKGQHGVCCGHDAFGARCCPTGAACFRCRGEYRCGATWSAGCAPHDGSEQTVGLFVLFLVVAAFVCAVCLSSACGGPAVPPVVSGYPVHGGAAAPPMIVHGGDGGVVTGMVAGMLLSDAMHDPHQSLGGASTDEGFEADA